MEIQILRDNSKEIYCCIEMERDIVARLHIRITWIHMDNYCIKNDPCIMWKVYESILFESV